MKTRKSSGTSCHANRNPFFEQTSKFLIKYNLLRFQISGGLLLVKAINDAKLRQAMQQCFRRGILNEIRRTDNEIRDCSHLLFGTEMRHPERVQI